MSDILEELRQEAREEKIFGLWQKYKNHVYAGVSAVLLLTVVYTLYGHYQKSQLEKYALQYANALSIAEKSPEKSLVLFEKIAGETSSVYGALSRLWAAYLLEQKGETENAHAVYAQALKEENSFLKRGKAHLALKEFLFFKKAYASASQADPDHLMKEVLPFAHGGNVWRLSAYELLAILSLRKNRSDEARVYLDKILDDAQAEEAFKIRARALKSGLGDRQ